jgi:hypothetical protein
LEGEEDKGVYRQSVWAVLTFRFFLACLRLCCGFGFGCGLQFGLVTFEGFNVFFVAGFAFPIDGYAEFLGFGGVHACLFDFVGAEAFALALGFVGFDDEGFDVVH